MLHIPISQDARSLIPSEQTPTKSLPAEVYEWLTAAVEMLVPLVPFVMLVAMNVM
jgi:hypothetical protein